MSGCFELPSVVVFARKSNEMEFAMLLLYSK